MLLKLLARALPQDHENDKKVFFKARHRYERPSVLHADKDKKHHGAHGLSKYVNTHLFYSIQLFFKLKIKLIHQKRCIQKFFPMCYNHIIIIVHVIQHLH